MNNFIDLLWPYNDDEYFYIYEYGFQLKKGNDKDINIFPINRKIDSPCIIKDNIKSVYSNFLDAINFSKNKSNLDLILYNLKIFIK